MTRRELNAIAADLRACISLLHTEGEHARAYGAIDAALALADTFGELNPNFNRRKFLDACGLEDSK
jgi:hypothetical protein